jgi:hypothetical protein
VLCDRKFTGLHVMHDSLRFEELTLVSWRWCWWWLVGGWLTSRPPPTSTARFGRSLCKLPACRRSSYLLSIYIHRTRAANNKARHENASCCRATSLHCVSRQQQTIPQSLATNRPWIQQTVPRRSMSSAANTAYEFASCCFQRRYSKKVH